MRTVIDVVGVRITVERSRFRCDYPGWRALAELVELPRSGSYIPDEDLALAQAFTRRYGGRIVEYAGPRPRRMRPDSPATFDEDATD